MKGRTQILLLSVIVFLVALIVVQFMWIYRAAVNQEKQFEFAVVVAINKAINELHKKNKVCIQVIDSFDENGYSCCNKNDLRRDLWVFIDSIIQSELRYSKIGIDYVFQLSTVPHPHPVGPECESKQKCFTVKSNMKTSKEEYIWLHIDFPGRDRFIMAQIGMLFIVSIILILLTIGAFVLIYLYYRQEQVLANDTRNFINNLTHEFKTPISSIRLANNRIVKATHDKVDVESYTSIITQENKKLEEHVNYLLDISRLRKGRILMNCENIDLHELLKEQSDSFKLRIEDRRGKLELDLIAENYSICADSFHLANTINNILDNACKYTPEQPVIKIATKNKNGSIVIAISDNGVGIEKSDQKTIFQEFSRVNTGNLHNVKGFGLGLSYVWQIVKMHKGNLKLESSKNSGSTFYIYLPTIKNGKS